MKTPRETPCDYGSCPYDAMYGEEWEDTGVFYTEWN